jgi:hypothetical protein
MGRRGDEHQKVFPFAFRPKKPKRGWYLVCMRRRRVYGRVATVRRDKTFKRIGSYGVFIDSRKSNTTWESIQFDESGEYRFVESPPPGFEVAPHLALGVDAGSARP